MYLHIIELHDCIICLSKVTQYLQDFKNTESDTNSIVIAISTAFNTISKLANDILYVNQIKRIMHQGKETNLQDIYPELRSGSRSYQAGKISSCDWYGWGIPTSTGCAWFFGLYIEENFGERKENAVVNRFTCRAKYRLEHSLSCLTFSSSSSASVRLNGGDWGILAEGCPTLVFFEVAM